MDERLKRRFFLFYGFGIFNAFLGLYILFEGTALLGQETAMWAVVLCLAFAAANFYMPYAIRKKWEEDQARLKAQRGAAPSKGDGRT